MKKKGEKDLKQEKEEIWVYGKMMEKRVSKADLRDFGA